MRGPAVQCMSIDAHDPFWDALQRNVRSYLDSTSNNHIGYNEIGRMFTYLSWTNSNSSDLPFVYSNPDSAEGVMELQAQLNTGNESYTRELNLAVFPRANILASGRPPPQVWNESSGITDELMDYYFEDATLLYCRLAAVERLIRFTFNGTDQAQYIEVLKTSKFKTLVRERILGLALLDSGEEDVPLDFDAIKINDASSVVYSGFGGSDRGWIILEQVAFQAVWGAFRTLIVGQMDSVSSQLIFLADPELNTYANRSRLYPTQVLSTSLAQTEDLHLLNTLTPSTSNRDVPDLLKSHVRGDQYLGLLPPKDASTFGYSQNAPRKSLKDGIEELFWNISISMASSPDLLYNATNMFAPPEIEVTYKPWGNSYNYSPIKLWLPYGIALGVTFLDVSIGLWAMLALGASYTANFSTVFRIAKNAYVRANTQQTHLPGRDPLPEELAKARLKTKKQDVLQSKDQLYVKVYQAEEGLDGASM